MGKIFVSLAQHVHYKSNILNLLRHKTRSIPASKQMDRKHHDESRSPLFTGALVLLTRE